MRKVRSLELAAASWAASKALAAVWWPWAAASGRVLCRLGGRWAPASCQVRRLWEALWTRPRGESAMEWQLWGRVWSQAPAVSVTA